jgi:hypothetical protein
MPSKSNDLGSDPVQQVLADAQSVFSSAVASTAESLRGTLASLTGGSEAQQNAQAAQLGNFASSRMDADAFSAFAETATSVDDAAVPVLKLAQLALEQITAAGHKLFEVQVAPGKNVRCAVNRALSRIGRAFAAARVIELAQAGNYLAELHADMLDGLRFAEWSSSERRLAPPLVVRVQGNGLQASALIELLDGNQKFVLLLDGNAGPAPLARAISPGTFVVQCQNTDELKSFVAWHGPGIAALVSDDAAQFRHDPQAGGCLSERLQVQSLPQNPKFKALGSLSAAQQSDQLAHLACLAQSTAVEPAQAAAAPSPTAPVDQLAAFLLNRAHLEEV